MALFEIYHDKVTESQTEIVEKGKMLTLLNFVHAFVW